MLDFLVPHIHIISLSCTAAPQKITGEGNSLVIKRIPTGSKSYNHERSTHLKHSKGLSLFLLVALKLSYTLNSVSIALLSVPKITL